MKGTFCNYIFLCLAVFLGTLSLLPPLAMYGLDSTPDVTFEPFIPQTAPEQVGAYAPNTKLDTDIKFIEGPHGAETVAFSKHGDMYFSNKAGEIRYIEAELLDGHISNNMSTYSGVANRTIGKLLVQAGRPVGMYIDAEDRLLVADAVKGLLRVDLETRDVNILTSGANGTKLIFLDDVKTGPDGMIYISDSARIGPLMDKNGDWNILTSATFAIASSKPDGRLLSYDPQTKETKVLMQGIRFANGVLVDPTGNSVYVCETSTYRVWRYWLKGINAGKSMVFIDNLPGYPDGINLGSDNRLYISLYGGRSKLVDWIHHFPSVKRLLLRIPFVKFPIYPPMIVIADPNSGEILDSLQGTRSSPLKSLTSAVEHDGRLYIGNLHLNFIGVYDLNGNRQ
ncbi:hypothetical protein SAMD00019534_006280 [Acytostelium subglobosum LB1]|uniref:hypothetical protein n=1 Tax=Acytostelium subglobosum LB1 TaxID=1410327 RepID=UPI000644CA65|nr:hypothetical protein SAMD00019534_006280 [Acytostelium subglobosum LB1]GAM17453.1 hypothetical protein SAMD00019534_006280 [Acytostelium subglobosum LB1]|eukprot:XP_012759515.1 hypothetical protein SAMD00019534_006280 [Acytostelium subglobosum LB1]